MNHGCHYCRIKLISATGLRINGINGQDYLADIAVLNKNMTFIDECLGAATSGSESEEDDSAKSEQSAESESDTAVLLGLKKYKKKT